MTDRRSTPGKLRPLATAIPLAATLLVGLPALAVEVEVTTLTPEPLPGAVGGVAVDALGIVHVADFGERVWKVTPQGEVAGAASGLYGSSGNAITASTTTWSP